MHLACDNTIFPIFLHTRIWRKEEKYFEEDSLHRLAEAFTRLQPGSLKRYKWQMVGRVNGRIPSCCDSPDCPNMDTGLEDMKVFMKPRASEPKLCKR